MSDQVTLDQVLDLASQLPVVDQVRLIEAITPRIKQELHAAAQRPRKSLRGLWKGLDISDADITAARRQMWGNFPREDV